MNYYCPPTLSVLIAYVHVDTIVLPVCSSNLHEQSFIFRCFFNDFIYTVSQKNVTLFYFCDIFVKFHPILLIFGRNMPQEI